MLFLEFLIVYSLPEIYFKEKEMILDSFCTELWEMADMNFHFQDEHFSIWKNYVKELFYKYIDKELNYKYIDKKLFYKYKDKELFYKYKDKELNYKHKDKELNYKFKDKKLNHKYKDKKLFNDIENFGFYTYKIIKEIDDNLDLAKITREEKECLQEKAIDCLEIVNNRKVVYNEEKVNKFIRQMYDCTIMKEEREMPYIHNTIMNSSSQLFNSSSQLFNYQLVDSGYEEPLCFFTVILPSLMLAFLMIVTIFIKVYFFIKRRLN